MSKWIRENKTLSILIGLFLVSIAFLLWVMHEDYVLAHWIKEDGTITDNGPGTFGDFSNWFQAFIAIWTLLAVIYTAMKAKQSADNSSELTEKAFMSDLLIHISEKANHSYEEYISIKDEEGKNYDNMIREAEDNISHPSDFISIPEEYYLEVEALWESHGGRLKHLNDMLEYIESAMYPIETTKYYDKNFYKGLFFSYLNSKITLEVKSGGEFFRTVEEEKKKLPAGEKFSNSPEYGKFLYTSQEYGKIQKYFQINVKVSFFDRIFGS